MGMIPQWLRHSWKTVKQVVSTQKRLSDPSTGNSATLPACVTIHPDGTSADPGQIELTDLELRGISKAGNLSWSGLRGNDRVKICQMFSAEQAEFAQKVAEHPELSIHFPRVFCRRDRVTLTEWIPGRMLTTRDLEYQPSLIDEIARFQAKLHHLCLPVESIGFDYPTFLEQRLLRFLGPFEPSPAISAMIQALKMAKLDLDPSIHHPDITPRNIVIDSRDRHWKIIDNELIGQSPYYAMDIFNTYASLGKSMDVLKRYIHEYAKHNDKLKHILQYKDVFHCVWSIRAVGSRLQRGRIRGAFEMAERLQSRPHPLLKVLEQVSSTP